MRVLRFAALIALSLVAPSVARAATAVAVAPAEGPPKSGADLLEKQVRAQLAAEGLEVVSEKALAKAAKKVGGDPTSAKAAKEAGADLLVVITIKKQKKAHNVTADLVDATTDRVIRSSKKSYKKSSSASAIGDVLGRELAEVAAGFKPAGGGEPARVSSSSSRIVQPKEDDETPPPVARSTSSSPRSSSSSASPPPKDSSSASTTVEPASPKGGSYGEGKLLQLRIGGGSQVTSAYTVAVGETVTGLAYNLTPLVLFEAGARLNVPGTGLGLELGFSFVPVKYNIAVEPMVEPAEPKGSFLNVMGLASYRLEVARFGGGEDSFYLAPMAGIVYESLSVEQQLDYSVVVSSSQIAPKIGATFGLGLGQLALELHAALNLILSYSESPDKTGEEGGGIGIDVGAAGRYWMSENFGVHVSAAYEYTRVTFTGAGTRTPFVDDPRLENATIFSGNLKTAVGVVLAL